jgi:hypothetical protein
MRTGRPKKALTLSPENRERLESLAHRAQPTAVGAAGEGSVRMDENLKGEERIAGGELQRVEELAYALWVERGCPVGSSEVDWFEAQRRLSLLHESADAQAV